MTFPHVLEHSVCFAVIYFLFVTAVCVLSLVATICVMYLNLRADGFLVPAMRPRVCI